MINLKELQLRNFFSYGNSITKVNLDFDEPILIVGENHDSMVDGELDNNGTGKTTILNGILFAFYGKPMSSDLKLDGMINNINKKNMYVAIIFEKKGTYYKIERWRKHKKLGGNGVSIRKGTSMEDFDDPLTPATRSINDYIVDTLLNGMPYEIFVRIVAYSAKSDSFLSLPVTSTQKASQTSILEELFQQTILTEKGTLLKAQIKETAAEITSLTELKERVEKEVSRYEEQFKLAEDSVDKWEKSHKEEIKSIKTEISRIENIDFDGEIEKHEKLKAINSDISQVESEIKNLRGKIETLENNSKRLDQWDKDQKTKIDKLKEQLESLNDIDFDSELKKLEELISLQNKKEEFSTSMKKLSSTRDDLVSSMQTLKDEVDSLKKSECPYCNQVFKDSAEMAEHKMKELKELAEQHENLDGQIKELSENISDIDDSITKISCMFDDLPSYDRTKKFYDDCVEKIDELKNQENPYNHLMVSDRDINDMHGEVQDLDKNLFNLNEKKLSYKPEYELSEVYSMQARLKSLKDSLRSKITEENPHKETINRLKKVFDNIDEIPNEKIDELKDHQKHQNFLLKLLVKKDSFIRQALLDINLPYLNQRLQHYLDMVGLPHHVMFTKDMTISIAQFNNPIDFANLSGGQQARINLAIAFAFRDIVQARHEKINFCILDECLDHGLSDLGIRLAAKMIKKIAKENNLSMYIITHRNEIKSSFEKQLKSTLKGGLTTLEYLG